MIWFILGVLLSLFVVFWFARKNTQTLNNFSESFVKFWKNLYSKIKRR